MAMMVVMALTNKQTSTTSVRDTWPLCHSMRTVYFFSFFYWPVRSIRQLPKLAFCHRTPLHFDLHLALGEGTATDMPPFPPPPLVTLLLLFYFSRSSIARRAPFCSAHPILKGSQTVFFFSLLLFKSVCYCLLSSFVFSHWTDC